MGRVKDKFVTLDEQIEFMKNLIKAVTEDDKSPFYWQFTDEKVDVMHGIHANLQTVQAWVNLPDYHQAALQSLDEAHTLLKQYANDDWLNSPKGILEAMHRVLVCEGGSMPAQYQDLIAKIAAIALIGVGKFVVPGSHQKGGARNG
jgi:hypothetical protein